MVNQQKSPEDRLHISYEEMMWAIADALDSKWKFHFIKFFELSRQDSYRRFQFSTPYFYTRTPRAIIKHAVQSAYDEDTGLGMKVQIATQTWLQSIGYLP